MVALSQSARRQGFTLVELLVCIAIISVLAICAFSVQQKVTRSARSTQCASNLRQIYTMMQLYMGDHNGSFPPANSWNAPNGPSGGDWTGLWYSPNKQANKENVGLAVYAGGQNALHKIVVCPENRSSTIAPTMYNPVGYPYIVNYFIMVPHGTSPAVRFSAVLRSTATILMVDSGTGQTPNIKWNLGFNSTSAVSAYVENRHQGRLNALWTDGHVSAMRREDIVGSNFNNK